MGFIYYKLLINNINEQTSGEGQEMAQKEHNQEITNAVNKLQEVMLKTTNETYAQKLLIKNLNEQVEAFKTELMSKNEVLERLVAENKHLNKQFEQMNEVNKLLVNKFNEQLGELRRSIILSTENANRTGRPPLTNEDVEWIKELRQSGLSQREVAERLGIGNGTVAKYDKATRGKKECM